MLFVTGALVSCMTLSLHKLWMGSFLGVALALGFAAVGYVPVALAFGIELTFPMPAATVNGSMLLLAQAIGFVQSLVIAFITDDAASDALLTEEELLVTRRHRSEVAIAYLAFTCFLAFGISCAVEEDLRRLKYMAAGNIDKRLVVDGSRQHEPSLSPAGA